MSNTPKISRDAGFERPKKIPTTRAKGAPAHQAGHPGPQGEAAAMKAQRPALAR
jgi:hypothetical protein